MTERALGSIIVGAVAGIGLAWALVEGISGTVSTKNNEKKLENNVIKIAKDTKEVNLQSLDLHIAELHIVKEYKEVVINGRKTKRWVNTSYLVLTGDGKDDNKQKQDFSICIELANNFQATDQEKMTSVVVNDENRDKFMKRDIYQNYSYSVPSVINEAILKEGGKVINMYQNNTIIYGNPLDLSNEEKPGSDTESGEENEEEGKESEAQSSVYRNVSSYIL